MGLYKLGIFTDQPRGCTGFAIVCHNIATEIAKLYPNIRVIYFGRFGIKGKGFEKESSPFRDYELVGCEGGVWRANTVQKIIRHYKLDAVFSEDDWWSAMGLIEATKKTRIPLHFLTPIDSLPIPRAAHKVLGMCSKVYTPNRSYKKINNAIFLPHGVRTDEFRPNVRKKKFDKFMFLWIGRDEPRKALGRAILAYEKALRKVDCGLVVRTDWTIHRARMTHKYLKLHNIPVLQDRMYDCPHFYLAHIYASCNTLLCTSKAGGFELSVPEAMACGTPALCTDANFMNMHIVDGKNGFKIPLESYTSEGEGHKKLGRIWGNISIDKLAKAMVWMVEHPKRVATMGRWARQYVIDNYSWSIPAQTIYNNLGLSKKKIIPKGVIPKSINKELRV